MVGAELGEPLVVASLANWMTVSYAPVEYERRVVGFFDRALLSQAR